MNAEPKQNEAPLEDVVDDLRSAAESVRVTSWVARFRARRLQIFLFFSLLIFFSLAVAARLDSDHYFDWDLAISRAVQSITLPGFGLLMRLVSIPGNSVVPFIMVPILFFFLLLLLRYRLEALALVFSAGLGNLINVSLKWLIGRPRPDGTLIHNFVHETSKSFPSGHVMHYVAFYGFIFFLVYTHLRYSPLRVLLLALTGSLILLVGLSRVYLGAHWPSDVAAAYIGGGVWLLFVISCYRKWIDRNHKDTKSTKNSL